MTTTKLRLTIMNSNTEKPWIEAGYKTFAREGLSGLKVEKLARLVQKSKSSFYHLFADVEIFTDCLLEYHIVRGKAIAEEAKCCKTMVPDMIALLLTLHDDLLFNRQLRIHRNNPDFKRTFELAHKPVEAALFSIWTASLGLEEKPHLARIILSLIIDNFYLRLTEETLTESWLIAYLAEIQMMVRESLHSSI